VQLSFSEDSVNRSAKGEDSYPTPLRSATHQSNGVHVMEQVFKAILLLMTDLSVPHIHPACL